MNLPLDATTGDSLVKATVIASDVKNFGLFRAVPFLNAGADGKTAFFIWPIIADNRLRYKYLMKI